MFIELNGKSYQLRHTLGVAKKLEDKFKKTTTEIMAELKNATIDEMTSMLAIALEDSSQETALKDDLLDHADLFEVSGYCDELLMRICFGGTPQQQEEKIQAFPASARRKDLMRRVLKLPIPSTSEELSEQATE